MRRIIPVAMIVVVATMMVQVGIAARQKPSSSTITATSTIERVQRAVCHYFRGQLCGQAMSVVKCETGGTYSVWAGYKKHDYWGLFQMGSKERRTYGHAWNAWGQARAAYAYYKDSGWSPWQCIPYGGLRW